VDTEQLLGTGYRQEKKAGADRTARGKAPTPAKPAGGKEREGEVLTDRPASELADTIEQLTERMRAAAAELQFEVAARLRDEVSELRKELRQMKEAGLK